MYKVYDDYDNKGKVLDKTEFMDINGFLMGGKKKVFSVAGSVIREIKVVSKNEGGISTQKIHFVKED